MANHTVLVSVDGRRIPVDDSASPIRDEAGQVIGGVLVFRDVLLRSEQPKEFCMMRRRSCDDPMRICRNSLMLPLTICGRR